MSDLSVTPSDRGAKGNQSCCTCGHYNSKPVNTHDAQTGTYNVCVLDVGHPGARFANPALTCRLTPIQWVRK